MTVFIDTGVFIAGTDRNDGHHALARQLLTQLGDEPLVTTDAVLFETWAYIRNRRGWESATRFWATLRHTSIRIEFVTAADLERSESIATSWSDQQFSMVDCTSFAVMERLGINRVASFDKDFAVYRHSADRRLAFEVLR